MYVTYIVINIQQSQVKAIQNNNVNNLIKRACCFEFIRIIQLHLFLTKLVAEVI